MRYTFLFLLIAQAIWAQEPSGEQAIQKVFKVLSGAEEAIPALEDRNKLLQTGAWEALAYIDRERVLAPTPSDLNEAVPDYYHFTEKGLIFKLIDPKDHNHYGFEGRLSYRWEKNYLVLISEDSGQEKDRWKLLYLDDNYLALRIDNLSVFLTQTRAQEP